MKEFLLDLIYHQAWADAEHWKAMQAYPQSLQDEDITKRLFHIHLVQSGLLAVVLSRPIDRKQSRSLRLHSVTVLSGSR